MIIYTSKEVAEILKIKESSVGTLVREGKIKRVKGLTGNIRVSKEELDKFIKGE